jgi:predicted acylesterase/phospholipase RssA
MKWLTWLSLVAALVTAGCATGTRMGAPTPSATAARPEGFDAGIRNDGMRRSLIEGEGASTLARLVAASDGSLDILALSGGGAGGAYGAGVLLGLTESHRRPRFEVVTGVSTGALIAPFAFLGPAWDAKLREGYSGEATLGLLRPRGIGTLFSTSIYEGRPLRELVERFVTADLIEAVARESRAGRLLLVATTNLDREEATVWNLGLIAERGGEPARKLFVDVLTASASVPGVFPPVMIPVKDGDRTYMEMHVNGGVSTTFFVAPAIAVMLGFKEDVLRGGHIYVIVNGKASDLPRATKVNAIDITARSFSTVLKYMSRDAIAEAGSFARDNAMTLEFTRIPDDVAFGGILAFDPARMKGMLAYGERCAARGRAWLEATSIVERKDETGPSFRPEDAPCPLAGGAP